MVNDGGLSLSDAERQRSAIFDQCLHPEQFVAHSETIRIESAGPAWRRRLKETPRYAC